MTTAPSGSGVAESFDARGEYSQWPPLTATMSFKKSRWLLSFLLFGSNI
jgi:hypothetical protein